MSIDTEPALRAERELRQRAIEGIAAACRDRVDLIAEDVREPATLRDRIPEGALVTCFDVLDRVAAFAPLVEALLEAARERGATVVLALPNDALGDATPTPTTWTEGALAELRGLLPEGHVAAGLYDLRGAAVVREGGSAPAEAPVEAAAEVPVGWLVAFGAHADALGEAAAVAPVDTLEQRRWERAREADLAFFRAAAGDAAARPDPAP